MPNRSSRSGARGAGSGIRVRECRSSTRISPAENDTTRPSFSRRSSTAERKLAPGWNVSRHRSSNSSRGTGAREDLERARPLRNALEEFDTPSAAAARDAQGAERRLGLSPGGAQEGRERKPDVADPLIAVERDDQRGVIEVGLDPPERDAAIKPQFAQERVKRRRARKARSPGSGFQVIRPENLGEARLRVPVGNLGVAHDLRSGLERNALVEPRVESLEVANPGFRARQLERLEDLVGRDRHFPLREPGQILRFAQEDREGDFAFSVSFSTSAAIRLRASSLNQKSRNGSFFREASKRATASARAPRLTSA